MVSWACMQWSVAIDICWHGWWLLHLNTGLVLVSSAMSVMQLWSKVPAIFSFKLQQSLWGVSFLCFNIKFSANAIVIMLTKLKCSLSGLQALFGCLFLSWSLIEHLCVLLRLVHVLPLSFLNEGSFFELLGSNQMCTSHCTPLRVLVKFLQLKFLDLLYCVLFVGPPSPQAVQQQQQYVVCSPS